MHWVNIIIVLMTVILGLLATHYLLTLRRESALRIPVLLLSGSLMTVTLGFVWIDLSLTILFFLGSSHHGIIVNFFYRLGFVFEMVGCYLAYLTLTLPRLKENSPRAILSQLFVVTLFGTSAAINASSITMKLSGEKIIVAYDFVGFLFLLLAVSAVVGAFTLRMKEIGRVMTSKNLKKEYQMQIVVIACFILVLMLLLIWDLLAVSPIIPNFSWALVAGMMFIFISSSVRKNEGFLFAMPVTIDALYILDSTSCIPIYTRTFNSNARKSEAMLGSVLGSLKLSLEALVTSKEGLQAIAFVDKVLVMDSGSLVTTFLIVSEVNPLVLELTSNLTTLFENTYHDQVKAARKQRMISPQEFALFDLILNRIKTQLFL